MDEETKEKNTSTEDMRETEGQAIKTNSNKKKSLKWIVGVITMVMAAVVIGFVTYTQSPSYRAKQQLDLGEKYLEDMDYEQAIANFQLALEIEPDNADVATAIMAHMDDFYQQARVYGDQGEFAAEKNIAVFMLSVDENSYQAMIAEAEAAYGTGDIKTAKDAYEKAKKAGAKAEDADPGIELCDAVLKLLELCEAGNFSGVVDFINTADFEPVKNMLAEGKQISCSGEIPIIIGLNEGSYYVACGDIEGGILNGNGTAMISSINTNSIYEGSFSENKPEGSGKLSIWNKNESISVASVYEGVFEEGILNGKANYVAQMYDTPITPIEGWKEEIIITAVQGKIKVGDYWGDLELSNDEFADMPLEDRYVFYCLEYEEEENGFIYNYVAGVPGYGGSDKVIIVHLYFRM